MIRNKYTLLKHLGLFAAGLLCLSCTKDIDVNVGNYPSSDSGAQGAAYGDIESIESLDNPDRGYHIECNMLLHNLKNPYFDQVFNDNIYKKYIEVYSAQEDNVTLVQQYVYLTEWMNKDLPQEAFDQLEVIFAQMKKDGMKAILRFAYNWQGLGKPAGETEKGILRHLEQLKPFLHEHMGQIAAVQAGFIGAWGEWHTSGLSSDQKAKNSIVSKLLEVIPDPYCVEIRYPKDKSALKLSNEDKRYRLGYCNDYFTAGEHPKAMDNDYMPGTPVYNNVLQEVEKDNFYISGEIPYNENSEFGLHQLLTPLKCLKILSQHRYSAFDISQNFDLNIISWKRVPINPIVLKGTKVLYDERYFRGADGQGVSRSMYQFIRDHLGYRLNLKNVKKLSAEGNNLSYDFTITNTGFARVINPKKVYLVAVSEQNEVIKEVALDVDPRQWLPRNPETGALAEYQIKGQMELPAVKGNVRIGIWMPDVLEDVKDLATFDVKFACNDNLVHWTDPTGKYAVNVIGELEL